jgi:hypothetical protein
MLVIGMGLASRQVAASLPPFVAAYAGDTLWAVLAFVVIACIEAGWETVRVAVAALLTAYAVELSQLYHAPWIEAVRNTRLGALALGFGFLWSDIACYTVGVVLCVAIEQLASARAAR